MRAIHRTINLPLVADLCCCSDTAADPHSTRARTGSMLIVVSISSKICDRIPFSTFDFTFITRRPLVPGAHVYSPARECGGGGGGLSTRPGAAASIVSEHARRQHIIQRDPLSKAINRPIKRRQFRTLTRSSPFSHSKRKKRKNPIA